MTDDTKRCGTCRWWTFIYQSRITGSASGNCEWVARHPIFRGWRFPLETLSMFGTDCPTYQPKEASDDK